MILKAPPTLLWAARPRTTADLIGQKLERLGASEGEKRQATNGRKRRRWSETDTDIEVLIPLGDAVARNRAQ